MHNTDEYSNGLLVERTQLLDSSTRWNLFHMHSRGSGSASLYELGYSASQGITYTLQERREANCDLATWRLIDQKLLTNIFFSKVLLPWEDSNQRNGRKKSKQESFGSIFCLKKKKFFITFGTFWLLLQGDGLMAPGVSHLIFKPAGPFHQALLEINRLSCSLVRFTTVITSHFQP